MAAALQADVIVVGAGLAGLVAATELTDAGRRVLLLEQEGEQSLGGQSFWSLGGLFLVDSPEQRRLGVKDSLELARADWMGTAAFDRPEDHWPKLWAEAYLQFAAGEKRAWLRTFGVRFFPIVGWAERGGYGAIGHGNSVPRFHLAWGTGPGVLEPFRRRAREAETMGLLRFCWRHRVDGFTSTGQVTNGVHGALLEATNAPRGVTSSRSVVGEFCFQAQAVIVASGGIGGNHALVRKNWPERLGRPPAFMVSGVPEHVDGRMIEITEDAGGSVINRDRMWHYVEGVRNFAPIWPKHGIRILPGPSSMWFDATGQRLPAPLYPGYDTLGQLAHIMKTGFDYTWFILNQSILRKEFGLSGSEQNPDITGKSVRKTLARMVAKGAAAPVEAFKTRGEDFIVRKNLEDLVAAMNGLMANSLLDPRSIRAEIEARDLQIRNPFAKDAQVVGIHNARRYRGDRIARTAAPHALLDPSHGPLIAVRLNILTRKTLGGLETDLQARVIGKEGGVRPGLYAVGEAAGFGGGGMHGYRALEGTFLGGCLFSGRNAGRAIARAL